MNPSIAATTVQELVAASKRKTGGLTYASSGNGGSPHLATELLRKFTGMNAGARALSGRGAGARRRF